MKPLLFVSGWNFSNLRTFLFIQFRTLYFIFYFIVLMDIVASVIGMDFFFICVSGFRLKFSRIAFLQKRLQLDSKTGLITNGLIFGLFVGIWLFLLTSYLHGLKSAWIAQVCCSFDIKSFRWLVWGVFGFVLYMCPYFSAIEFCDIDWWALAMHCNFTSFVCSSSLLASPQEMMDFCHDCITCKRR